MSNDEIRILINEALSFGYHTAKDEAKGIPSSGYGTRFFDMHNLEQKLDIASVSDSLRERSDKISLLENFSTFLCANNYMDSDWREEPPYAIDEFMKLISKEQ